MLAHAIRNLLVASALLSTAIPLTNCGAQQTDVNDGESEAKDSSSKPSRGRVKDKDAVSEKGKKWGGWRWKGKSNDCFYVFENQCFADKKSACKAAKCGDKKCKVKDGAPAKVKCSS